MFSQNKLTTKPTTFSTAHFVIKLLLAIIVFLTIVIIGLSLTLVTVFPLKTKEIQFISLDHASNMVVSVKKIEELTPRQRNEFIMRDALKRYIFFREGVNIFNSDFGGFNKLSIKERVLAQSSLETKLQYKQILENKKDIFKNIFFKRDVNIKSMSITNMYLKGNTVQDDIINDFKIDWSIVVTFVETNSRKKSKKTFENIINITAYLNYSENIKVGDIELNPVGLIVERYAVQKFK